MLQAVNEPFEVNETEEADRELIAVVGMACRFPGAPTVDDYWRLLINGDDAISDVPGDRWDLEAWYDPNPGTPGKMNARGGGFIDNVFDFDASFFGIAPREAASVDPQQRLLLETVWNALENAGHAPSGLTGSLGGIYIGISTTDYLQTNCSLNPVISIDPYSGTGTAVSIAAGRISYILGFEGPSFAVDTACSSSVVATHLACQSLRRKECDFAVCAGVNLMLAPQTTVYFCQLGVLSPESRCKTFDAAADGYVRGEGCGAVVLKRLSDAIADGDTVLAVIQGSAVNHDGRSTGLTAPRGPAQKTLLRRALQDAGASPMDIDWIEAHGTGTPLGDRIELNAIGAVYRQTRTLQDPVMVASAKTNIGHLEAAAGMAGLIKVVLALQHKEIPAHLNFRQPNPYVTWKDLPIEIPTAPVPWARRGDRRMAGLSSFGFSGTNAHLIIGEAQPAASSFSDSDPRPVQLLCLSAKTEAGLQQFVQDTRRRLASTPDTSFPDLCYTANAGRSPFAHRLSICAGDRQAAMDALQARLDGKPGPGLKESVIRSSQAPKIAFLFAGQGVQHAGMGRELYETQPVFRNALRACENILDGRMDHALTAVLYDPQHQALLERAVYSQPATFAVEYALAKLWESWGIEPAIAMGYSSGEYTAACIAGAIRLEDGLRLACLTGLMENLTGTGMMAAVQLEEAAVDAAIAAWAGQVAIAAVNGPTHTVISGPGGAVGEAVERFESKGIKCHRLNISHGFHSSLVDPLLDDFEREAGNIKFTTPRMGLISGLTGNLVSRAELSDPAYWSRQFRKTVRFAAGLQTLRQHDCDALLELSPQPVLLSMARECIPEKDALWLPSLGTGRSDWNQLTRSLSALYLEGASIDWRGVHRPYGRKVISFPNYPFQKKRYTNIDPVAVQKVTDIQRLVTGNAGAAEAGLKRLRSAALKDTVFQVRIDSKHPSFMGDHQIYDMTIVPGVFYLALALTAGMALRDKGSIELSGISFIHPLILNEDEAVAVQLVLAPAKDGKHPFRVMSAAVGADEWVTHAVGNLRFAQAPPEPFPVDRIEALKQNCREHGTDADGVYKKMSARGYVYGPSFRWMNEAWQGEQDAMVRVKQPAGIDPADAYVLHPGLMDACAQALALTVTAQQGLESGVYIPVSIDKIKFRKPRHLDLLIHVRMPPPEDEASKTISADITLCSENGETVLEMTGVKHRHAPRSILARFSQRRLLDWLYVPEWVRKPLAANAPVDKEPPAREPYWILFADRKGTALKFGQLLQGRGESPVLVYPGDRFEQTAEDAFNVGPDKPEHFERLLSRCGEADSRVLQGIVFMWSLDPPVTTDFDASDNLGARPLLYLIRALAQSRRQASLNLWLCTRGVHCIGTAGSWDALAYAPLWGMTGAAAMEQPGLRCIRVDLDPQGEVDTDVLNLFNDLQARGREDQIAFRGNDRYVHRLRRYVPPALSSPDGVTTDKPYRLEPSKQGVLKDLHLVPSTRQKPGPGQVEIEIRASSLNFRDVLNAMNLYPGDAGPLGLECAGRISAVGQGAPFKVGDKVLGLAWECFSKYALTNAEMIVPLPAHMTYADGATIPITFLTADAALRNLARITAGDKVLIHAGAGGVGQAAIQIAQQVGAEIFATAGSPVKRTYLRDMGVHHVFDSRSFAFVEEIKTLTDGKGVDVVLNSLAGEYVPRSLSILGSGGRFVEIGKIDIWDEPRLAEVRSDVDYHIFALDDLLVREPETISAMLTNLMPEFTPEGLQPLRQTRFEIDNANKAFEFMAKAGHIGKIVLNHPRSEAQVDIATETPVHKDATYLITGGLGGLGLVIARWLVQQGGQHIVLVGRSAPSEEALQMIEPLEIAGARIYIQHDDVTDRLAVEHLLGKIEAEMPPLKGVFHAAGVIDDGMLARQEWQRFKNVMAPKVAGAAHLHEFTRNKGLDHFVLFSSIASLLGSPGQSNYAAGNAFLDALAHHRHAAGLPALCINWGPWRKLGMTARLDDAIGRHWSAMGIGSLSLPLGLTAIELLMEQHPPQVGVMGVDWTQLTQRFPPDLLPPAIEELVEGLREYLEPSREWLEFVEKLRAALPNSRKKMMIRYLQDKAAEVLELESSQQIDPDAPLNELGFDSLMAVELANRIGAAAGIVINPTLLFDYPTLAAIAGYFVDEALDLEGEGGVRQKTAQADQTRESITEMLAATMRDRPQSDAPATGMMSETTEAILEAIDSMTDQEVDRLVQGNPAVKEA